MVIPAELMMDRRLRTRLDLLFPDIGKTVLEQQNRQRAYFGRPSPCRRMMVGDAVFARNYAAGLQWLPGVIIGTDGPVSYVVRLFDGRIWRRHGDQLRRRQSAEPISPPEAASR